MPDPVSNAEIEDVLSSIRRLVSEEPQNAKRRAAGLRSRADRLVLTPALRVEETMAGNARADSRRSPNAAWQPDADDQPDLSGIADLSTSARDPEGADADHGILTLEDRVAGLEAALLQSDGEWEPDGSEDGSSDLTRPISADADFDMAEAWDREIAGENDADPVEDEPVADTILDETTDTEVKESASGDESAEDESVEEVVAEVQEPDDTTPDTEPDTAASPPEGEARAAKDDILNTLDENDDLSEVLAGALAAGAAASLSTGRGPANTREAARPDTPAPKAASAAGRAQLRPMPRTMAVDLSSVQKLLAESGLAAAVAKPESQQDSDLSAANTAEGVAEDVSESSNLAAANAASTDAEETGSTDETVAQAPTPEAVDWDDAIEDASTAGPAEVGTEEALDGPTLSAAVETDPVETAETDQADPDRMIDPANEVDSAERTEDLEKAEEFAAEDAAPSDEAEVPDDSEQSEMARAEESESAAADLIKEKNADTLGTPANEDPDAPLDSENDEDHLPGVEADEIDPSQDTVGAAKAEEMSPAADLADQPEAVDSAAAPEASGDTAEDSGGTDAEENATGDDTPRVETAEEGTRYSATPEETIDDAFVALAGRMATDAANTGRRTETAPVATKPDDVVDDSAAMPERLEDDRVEVPVETGNSNDDAPNANVDPAETNASAETADPAPGAEAWEDWDAAADDGADDPLDLPRDSESVIDEEALREMVAQLIREELQGALGERITRNVRRLVRREIERAFAIRDLK